MIVVSDTSPLSYLALVGQEQLLRVFFGETVIPTAVLEELSDPAAPVEVRRLPNPRQPWIRVVAPALGGAHALEHLDRGEREAIQIAVDLQATLVVIDESEGSRAAESLGLAPIGTIGILERGIRQGLVDGPGIAARLRATGFRASAGLLARLER